MITIQDLQQMLDEAIDSGRVKLNSEVRYISRDREDCSFEPQWVSIGPGHTKSGVPVDRRYGDGALFLAQEQRLRDAPEQLCLALDW
jgi:hypothetical protein